MNLLGGDVHSHECLLVLTLLYSGIKSKLHYPDFSVFTQDVVDSCRLSIIT